MTTTTTSKPDIGKMEAELRTWGAELDKLVAKADTIGTQGKADYHKRINDIKTKRNVAQAKLTEFKQAGSDKWDHFKGGIEKAWSELEHAFKDTPHKMSHNHDKS